MRISDGSSEVCSSDPGPKRTYSEQMLDSPHPLHRLRRQIAAIGRPLPKKGIAVAATGHPGIDRALGGGLPRGRLHEVFAAEPDDAGSAAGLDRKSTRLNSRH